MAGRGLQDLCRIISYLDNYGLLVSSVYFKGRLEPFETDNSGILLGDILSAELDTSEIDKCEEFKLFESITSGEGDLFVYHGGLSSMEGSEVARVISDCYGAMDINAYSLYKPVKDYLETCANNNVVICLQTWNMFCATYGIEMPERYKTFKNFYCDFDDNIHRPDPYLLNKDNSNFVDSLEIKPQILTIYDCDELGEIVISLLNQILESGFTLKRCEQCGRWFIPLKADEKYCGRTFKNLSCKQKAILEKRNVRLRSDLIGKAYNRVLTNLSNRVYATTITETEQEQRAERVARFKFEYHEKRKSYKKGALLESDFLTWIENQKSEGKVR